MNQRKQNFNSLQHPNPKKYVSDRLYSKSKSIVQSQLVRLQDTIFSFRYDNSKTHIYSNITMNQRKQNFNSFQHPNPKKNISELRYKYVFSQMDNLFKSIILIKIPTVKYVNQKKYIWLTKNIIHLYSIPPPHS